MQARTWLWVILVVLIIIVCAYKIDKGACHLTDTVLHGKTFTVCLQEAR